MEPSTQQGSDAEEGGYVQTSGNGAGKSNAPAVNGASNKVASTPLKEVFSQAAAAGVGSLRSEDTPQRSPDRLESSPSSAERGSARLQELFEEAERRKAKLKELESTLPSECTFSPAINRYRTKAERELVSPEKRIDKLYEDAKLKEERRRQAIEEAANKTDPEATFSPAISTRASKFSLPGGPSARSEKLYQDAMAKKEKQEALRLEAEKRSIAELTFRPTIQPLRIRLNEPRPVIQARRGASPTAQTAPVPEVVNRLLSAEQKRAEHLARLERQKIEREKMEYTFTPQVHVRNSPSPKPPGFSTTEDKWSRLSRAGAKDYAALEEAKEKIAVKDCTFKPVVHATPPTSALVITAEKVDVHSRLYDDARTRLRDEALAVAGGTKSPVVIMRGNSPVTIRRAPSPSQTAVAVGSFRRQQAQSPTPLPRGPSPTTTVNRAPSPSAQTTRGGRSSPVPANPLKASPLVVPARGGAAKPVATPMRTTSNQPRSTGVAFGSSSASRIPGPKDSQTVVPIMPKDSPVVVPVSDPVVVSTIPPVPSNKLMTPSRTTPSVANRRQSPTPMTNSKPLTASSAATGTRRAPSPVGVSPPSPRLGGRLIANPTPSSAAKSVTAIPARAINADVSVQSPAVNANPFSSGSAFSPLKAPRAPSPTTTTMGLSPRNMTQRPPSPKPAVRAPSPVPSSPPLRRAPSPTTTPSPQQRSPATPTQRAPSPKSSQSPPKSIVASMVVDEVPKLEHPAPIVDGIEESSSMIFEDIVRATEIEKVSGLDVVATEDETQPEAAAVTPSSPSRPVPSAAEVPTTPMSPLTEAARWNAEVKDEDL